MGTKFRTMLAPIGASTGDGRRFAAGGITLADLPMPIEWARSREGGHDGAVSVGAVQEAKVLTVEKALADGWVSEANAKGMDPKSTAVWAKGEMYDDADRETMPRLAEDVAEAMHLATNGTLGPSVDLDSFEAQPVMEGTDTPVTWSDVEDYYEEHGEEPKMELLVTQGRVRAATLVSIPAFSETSRPFELVAPDPDSDQTTDVLALIASVGTTTLPEVARFTLPELSGPTPITWDFETGRVFGHIATWRTCHVGYEGVCITPPKEDDTYAFFNRHPVETSDGGTVWAGRITVGGRHAGLSLNASATMSAYDVKTTAAHVRAYADEHGIVVAGVIEPGLTAAEQTVLGRRKVSGDWRETPGGLNLVEVLALSPGPRAHSEPGFPVAETFSRSGRQVALTAALGPEAGDLAGETATVDIEGALDRALDKRAAREVAAKVREDARAALASTLEPMKIQARAALSLALNRKG